MTKIVVFGNCQAGHLHALLTALLDGSRYACVYFANNPRAGGDRPAGEVLAAIGRCDMLIYQPLSPAHGDLSGDAVCEALRPGALSASFSYCFNSGIYSLCHAPLSPRHSYGMIYGEEVVIDLVRAGMDRADVLDAYRANRIDFRLRQRFADSLEQMRERERTTDVRLAGFIEEHYRTEKLFTTHNHPTNRLITELARQAAGLLALPVQADDILRRGLPELPETNCPISPHDIAQHCYTFSGHQDWFVKGGTLIDLIIGELQRGDGDEDVRTPGRRD